MRGRGLGLSHVRHEEVPLSASSICPVKCLGSMDGVCRCPSLGQVCALLLSGQPPAASPLPPEPAGLSLLPGGLLATPWALPPPGWVHSLNYRTGSCRHPGPKSPACAAEALLPERQE